MTRIAPLLKTTALTCLTACALYAAPARAVDLLATPTGETVVGGAATFDRPAAGQLNVSQSTDRVVIDWNNFDIGKSASTQFFQPGSGSLAVNRVTGGGIDPTQILGTLSANGKVMVLDPNGVLFGKTATIDVGGIIASTGDVNTAEIMSGAGTFDIQGADEGFVENRGSITVAESGLAAFVAPTVRNTGVIHAKLGKIDLVAGSRTTVDMFGDDLISIAIPDDLEHALIENTGKLLAEGGAVEIVTSVAEDIVDNSINMSGIVDVSSATVSGGKIILSGAQDITVRGRMNASGRQTGGSITIDAHDIGVQSAARLDAKTTESGAGGQIELTAGNSVDVTGKLNVSGIEGSGTVRMEAGDNLRMAGRVDAQGLESGTGGRINFFSSGDEMRIDGVMNANGVDGGGRFILSSANIMTLTDKSKLQAIALNSNLGGHVHIDSGDLTVDGLIDVHGVQDGGTMNIAGANILINNRLDAHTTQNGPGGDIKIASTGGLLRINNRLNVSGANDGGRIELSNRNAIPGENSSLQITSGADLLAESKNAGPGGTILIDGVDISIAGDLSVNGANGGGTVTITGFEPHITGDIQARAIQSGAGGDITVDADGDMTLIGTLNASGVNGGGTVLMTGDDAFLMPESIINVNATKSGTGGDITIDTTGEIIAEGQLLAQGRNGGGTINLISGFVTLFGEAFASATKAGNGGTVHFQGSQENNLNGAIFARGGSSSGDGGTVIIDTPNSIAPGAIVDVSAPNGTDGTFIH